MEGCVLLAALIGALAATALPVVPFCIGLAGALVVGVAAGFVLLPSPIAVLIGAIILSAAVQIGYGIGFGLWSLARYRGTASKKGSGPAPASTKEPAHHPR